MLLSVIVATYNWPEALEVSLNSILAPLIILPDNTLQNTCSLHSNWQIEIIIADDGSTDTTRALIAKYQQEFAHIVSIKHIWHEDKGFRKAMILNKAASVAIGEYMLFLDGDCVYFPDYLSQHLSLAQHGYFVAGNRVLLNRSFTKRILTNKGLMKQFYDYGWWMRFKLRWYGYTNRITTWSRMSPKARFRYRRKTNWRYPKGCNFALWRHDFNAVNGFDEAFLGWGHEDSDLFLRLIHNRIYAKDGRFAVPVIHLWHNVAKRDRANYNWQMLLVRAKNVAIIKASSGVDQYASLPVSGATCIAHNAL